MNILIVDDQPNVISSLLQRVPWQGIGISNVYTANSALAARDVLFSKQVDILLADIGKRAFPSSLDSQQGSGN